jgi:hypothetical protein
MQKLEEDSKNILQCMASNWLVAKESKTVLQLFFSEVRSIFCGNLVLVSWQASFHP